MAAGEISAERVATSFRRLMRRRVRLGMFDPPAMNSYSRMSFATVEAASHVGLAGMAAQRAICHYQNRQASASASPAAGAEPAAGETLFRAAYEGGRLPDLRVRPRAFALCPHAPPAPSWQLLLDSFPPARARRRR